MRVSRALASLPAEQREAIVLFDLEGITVDEIASLQGVSASAVKSRLARGRLRLRRLYVRCGFHGSRAQAGVATRTGLRPALAQPAQEERSHDRRSPS